MCSWLCLTDAQSLKSEPSSTNSRPTSSLSGASASSKSSNGKWNNNLNECTGNINFKYFLVGSTQSTAGFYMANGQRMLDIIKALVLFIAASLLPISIVDSEAFRVFIKVIDPRIRLPGRTALTSTHIPRIYNEAKAKLKRILDKVVPCYIFFVLVLIPSSFRSSMFQSQRIVGRRGTRTLT